MQSNATKPNEIEAVEAILGRLMPSALSQGAQEEMEGMLDELAGSATAELAELSPPSQTLSFLRRWQTGLGIAAAIGGLCVISLKTETGKLPSFATQQMVPGVVLVSASDRIVSSSDEGWQDAADGTAMRALRLRAVTESQVRDEASGMVVQISEPRVETLYMPISSF
jgi:hypothetical protein